MTGRMSDNPADSLRRELRETLDDAALTHTARSLGDIGSERVTDAIWPLVAAGLAAARADEREKAGDRVDSLTVRHHDMSKELLMESVRDRCAALARSAGVESKEQQA